MSLNKNDGDAAEPGRAAADRVPFVFISYRSYGDDKDLAEKFNGLLEGAGFKTFMAAESLRVGDNWPERVEEALERCDYFLLLLSARSAASDMVVQEVWRAKRLRDKRTDQRPRILPVRINLPFEEELNYDLDSYLGRIQQLPWQSAADTPAVFSQILEVINQQQHAGKQQDGADAPCAKPRTVHRREGPPVPVAEPEWPGGRVPRDSQFYIIRPDVDPECFEHVLTPAALLRIRAPRQMGKTSLLARVIAHAKENGCSAGQISFQLITTETMADLRAFMRHFCFAVGECMGLPDQVDEMWDDDRDVFHNCRKYFTRHLLRQIKKPFVLGMDEADLLFPHEDVAKQFFGMLRGWIDNSEDDELWSKFRVVMVHSTECYVGLSVDQSPFENIGRGFRLPPFSEKQVSDLARRHGLEFDGEARELFELVDGHPYLSRLAFYYVAREQKTFRAIIEKAHTEAGVFGDHLRRHYWNLTRYPELAAAFKDVVEAQAGAEARGEDGRRASVSLEKVPAFKLEGMGLVKPVCNEVAVSCELYRRYFQDRFRI